MRYSAHDGKLHLIHFFSLTSSGNELSTDILVLICIVLSFFLSLFVPFACFVFGHSKESKEREGGRGRKSHPKVKDDKGDKVVLEEGPPAKVIGHEGEEETHKGVDAEGVEHKLCADPSRVGNEIGGDPVVEKRKKEKKDEKENVSRDRD